MKKFITTIKAFLLIALCLGAGALAFNAFSPNNNSEGCLGNTTSCLCFHSGGDSNAAPRIRLFDNLQLSEDMFSGNDNNALAKYFNIDSLWQAHGEQILQNGFIATFRFRVDAYITYIFSTNMSAMANHGTYGFWVFATTENNNEAFHIQFAYNPEYKNLIGHLRMEGCLISCAYRFLDENPSLTVDITIL